MTSGRKKGKGEKRDEPFESKAADNPSIAMPFKKAEDYGGKKEKAKVLEKSVADLKERLEKKEGELTWLRSEKDKITVKHNEYRIDATEKITGLKKDVSYLGKELWIAKAGNLICGICLTVAGIMFGCWLGQVPRETIYLVCAILFAIVGTGVYFITLRRGDT